MFGNSKKKRDLYKVISKFLEKKFCGLGENVIIELKIFKYKNKG